MAFQSSTGAPDPKGNEFYNFGKEMISSYYYYVPVTLFDAKEWRSMFVKKIKPFVSPHEPWNPAQTQETQPGVMYFTILVATSLFITMYTCINMLAVSEQGELFLKIALDFYALDINKPF